MSDAFIPAWWLPGPHLQTLWPALFRRSPQPRTQRERLATPDGDFVDLDWYGPEGRLTVLLLHGLSGSSQSPYIRGMQFALAARGWRSAAMNFRGCSGEPNLTARGYHSGETGDIEHVYQTLRERDPITPLAAVGYSLGGNALLKWLGERGHDLDLQVAVAVSAPLRLELCADHLDQGFSRVYRDRLLQELKQYIFWKQDHLRALGLHGEADKLQALGDLAHVRSFWDYDDRVVARLYGFRDARDYYRQCSARPYLKAIQIPTLLIQAHNDPFMPPSVLPEWDELSPFVQVDTVEGGGHVGFVSGRRPWRPEFWLEHRIPAFLAQKLAI
jgi:hypothetical protein